MQKKYLEDEIISVAKRFIASKCYSISLPVSADLINKLKRDGFIVNNEKIDNYWFLTPEFYKINKKIIDSYNFSWVEIELLKLCSPLSVMFFDGELAHLFLNNPNYIFSWNGYRGYVCSKDDSRTDLYIKDLCLCHDVVDNKIVLGIFIMDLLDSSFISQITVEPYFLSGESDRYEYHEYNYKNLILGEWLEPEETDIYNVILEGIKIVNYVYNVKYSRRLFKNEYEIEDLQFYMPLFFPTKINRFNFMLELLKIILDNLNLKTLKYIIKKNYNNMKNKNEFSLDDLKDSEFREFKAFKLYYGQKEEFNDINLTKLDEIRNLRTEPAHKIYLNDLNYEYCEEQDEMLINIYILLNAILIVEDSENNYISEYKNGVFKCFYGKQGSISAKNGFNKTSYRYYRGYERLINDKFSVRDAEVMIAGNEIVEIKSKLTKCLEKNTKADKDFVNKVVNEILNNKICLPNERELKSFFYGQAMQSYISGETKNYKKLGVKLYNEFILKKYKYIFVFADSSEMYWNLPKTIEMLEKDKTELFGCGLILSYLTNFFSQDDSNIFYTKDDNLLFINNIWD